MRKIFLFLGVLFSVSVAAVAQRTIKGIVLDSKNEPVAGAQVAVKGTSLGTLTNADGMYSLTLSASVGNDATIVFSLLGYSPTEEKIGGRTTINVRLSEDEQALEDVVVVAFGQQKKESVTGSVTTISPKSLKVPSSNLTTSFQGRMAGMISYQTSGEPGADNASFFIRGITTFGDGRADPLILIDNIELDATDLARLNPDDIESFSILKDATATALYGSRGANGVILVKTKSGEKGRVNLRVRVENSFSMPTQELELADPITYMKLHNEAILTRDPLRAEIYSQEKIDNTLQPGSNPYIYPATDWRHEMLEDYTTTQRANINVSGGGDVATYYVSGTWAFDRGNFKIDEMNNFNNNINLQKIGIRANVNVNLTSSTSLKVATSASFDDYVGPPLASVGSGNTGGSNMYMLVMNANPVLFPAKYPRPDEWSYMNHTLFGNSDADVDGSLYLNPYAELVRGYQEYSRSNMLASLELKQKLDFFTEGLSARVLFNTSRLSYYSLARSFMPFYYSLSSWDKYTDAYTLRPLNPTSGTEYLGFSYGGTNMKFNTYIEGSANYDRDFGDHGVSGLLVGTLRNILNPFRGGDEVSLQSSLPERNMSLSGRFTYSYASRYFGEFNFGYNGSERFSDNHRFGFFPSAGLGWMISNERFFEPLSAVFTKLKLRYSYGLIGNDQIGNARFLYLSNVSFNGSAVGFGTGAPGSDRYSNNTVSISRYANDQITWETSTKSNYAIEMSLYDVELVAEYYTERREGILMERTNIPGTMGLWSSVHANFGEAQAKGIDISLDYNKIFNADFWMQARATFTYAHSEYIKFADFDYQNEWWKYHKGYPIKQRWGYIAEGLFVDDADVANSPKQEGDYMAGDIKYRDVNGDGQITTLDEVPIGYPTSPEINYGFGPSFGFYDFDLSFFFSGVARTSFFIDYDVMMPFANHIDKRLKGNTALSQFIVDSHWSETNKDSYAVWPRLSTEVIESNNKYSTWFMRDGTFLRLKQAEFGYTLPEKIVKRTGMTSARIYVSATNLLVFSKFKLWDPESRTPNTDNSNGISYPLQRVINIGANISF